MWADQPFTSLEQESIPIRMCWMDGNSYKISEISIATRGNDEENAYPFK